MNLGLSQMYAQDDLSKLGKTNLDDVMRFLSGQGFAKDAQIDIIKRLGTGVPTGAGIGVPGLGLKSSDCWVST